MNLFSSATPRYDKVAAIVRSRWWQREIKGRRGIAAGIPFNYVAAVDVAAARDLAKICDGGRFNLAVT